MKLIIDIPEEQYSLIMQSHRNGVACFIDKEAMMYEIKNGIPLDDLRAEIEQIIGEHNLDDYDYCSGLICARKIIDKYRNEVSHETDN